MKLNYDRKSKDPTYFAQIGYRDKNGKATTRNVKRIGKYSELLRITDDPLAYAKAEIEKMNREFKTGHSDFSLKLDFNKKLDHSDLSSSDSTFENIGYFYLQSVYQKLDLGKFFDGICNDRKNTFDCNTINEILTFARILSPGSKLDIHRSMHWFFDHPSFDYQHILRFMDILEEHGKEYIEWLYAKRQNIIPCDNTVMYFDGTNLYCETEQPDEDYIDEVTGEVMTGLRQYGASKEHRPNPIVELGLFIDSRGIPVSMCIHPGNTSEQVTAVPLEKEIIRMTKNSKFIYCADAGLGSYNIRLFNSMGGRAFVVTQSIKKMSEQLQQAVFNDYDYRLLSDDKEVSISYMKSFDRFNKDNIGLYNDKAYKVIEADKSVDLGLYEYKVQKNGKTRKVKAKGNLHQRIIITYSRKLMEYQRAVRNRQIERAKKLLALKDPEEIKKGPNDVKRFLKRKASTPSGEEADVTYILDKEKIAKEEMYDGYYAVATNLEDSAKDIMAIIHQRYLVEENFRLLKTNFEGRPIYHRKGTRIEAHLYICFLAMLIFKLMECQLDDQGTHVTPDQLISTMKNMNVLNIDDMFYRAAYTDSQTLQALEKKYNLQLDYHNYRPKELAKKIKKLRK